MGRVSGIMEARASAQGTIEAAEVAEATAAHTGLPQDQVAATNARAAATRQVEAVQAMEASASRGGVSVPANTMPYANGNGGLELEPILRHQVEVVHRIKVLEE